MNKILAYIFIALITCAHSVIAATQSDNKDDASNLGTAETPQHKKQEMRTDKGPVGANNGATEMDDASNLGTADTPQHKKQMERSYKNGATQNTHRHNKNKVMKNKEMNEGTTQGNKVQPTDTDNGTPMPVSP